MTTPSPAAGAFQERVVHCSQPDLNAQYATNELRTTKYTLVTFLPKNLMEQFSRHINRYFLIIALLQLWSLITPVSPITTWAPLIFVFAVSAAKEAFDDIGRARQDREANDKLYKVVRNGVLQATKSRDIRVGDVVRLADGDQVPCDLCLLASSAPDGSCTLQTMNLDGETNLKNRVAVAALQSRTVAEIETFRGRIYCAPPDGSVYSFDARIDDLSVSGDQLIQQTTTVRNTEFVYGVAVYTGPETKFALNRGLLNVKWTKLDAFVNRIAVALFALQLGLVVVFGVVGNVWEASVGHQHPYLGYQFDDGVVPGLRWVLIPLRFLLLNSTIIPISLKVTLDVCKLYYAKFIGWDRRFFDDDERRASEAKGDGAPLAPARANNTSISEDLGQIQCVLTDKTGTLTENQMVFRKCSIKGTLYGERDCGKGGRLFLAGEQNENSVTLDFLRNLALNSSVLPTRTPIGRIVYKSSSPDEESLVEAASQLGVQVVSRQGPVIELNVHGHTEFHIVRQELSFTSERRRMSVVVQDRATGTLTLYMKGGDDVVMERVKNQTHDDRVTLSHLNSFASEGLRTLAFARKTLDPVKYAAWLDRFNAANGAIQNREEQLAKVYDALEQGLELSGASAIEDRLQRGVPETIQSLRDAGVKIWMLTGDKFSTALQIATTCNLKSSLPESSLLLDINGLSEATVSAELDAHLLSLQSQRSVRDVALILRGASLTASLANGNRRRFLELCLAANAVICCRFSPKQKAQVVRMVKDAGLMTLAVGDGGNDVSMIMEAHVGVGIRGREGLQAARAADYQVNHFRSLLPLLLVHGRQSYLRSSLVSQYSYYKSFEFCLIQILFQFANGFSGTAIFNSASIAAYNVLLFVPILTFIFDQDVTGDEVLRIPEAYRHCQAGAYFNWKTFGRWTLRAVYQAIVIYVASTLVYNWEFAHRAHGQASDLETLGLVAFFSYLLVQSITLFLEMQYITLYNVVGVVGFHVLGMGLFYALSDAIKFDALIGYGAVQFVYTDPVFWVASLLIAALAVLPVVAVQYVAQQLYPDPLYETRKQLLQPPTDSHNKSHLSTDVMP